MNIGTMYQKSNSMCVSGTPRQTLCESNVSRN